MEYGINPLRWSIVKKHRIAGSSYFLGMCKIKPGWKGAGLGSARYLCVRMNEAICEIE